VVSSEKSHIGFAQSHIGFAQSHTEVLWSVQRIPHWIERRILSPLLLPRFVRQNYIDKILWVVSATIP